MTRPLALILPVLLLAASVRGGDALFADGFELSIPACVSGTLGGDTLPPSNLANAELLGCFEVFNDDVSRIAEVAVGSLPIARAYALTDDQLGRMVVIGPAARRWPADLSTLSRWGRPLADSSAPIRWLRADIAVDIAAGERATLALMRLPAEPATVDSGALSVSGTGDLRVVDTGLAEFTLDAGQTQPIRRIRVRESVGGALTDVFSATPGSVDEGWLVRVSEPNGTLIVEASEANTGSLQLKLARWEIGPGAVSARLHLDGHLRTDGISDHCPGDSTWVRFPFNLTIGLSRGSRDIDLQWQIGNACGIPQSAPDARVVLVDSAQFRLPMARGNEADSAGIALLDNNLSGFPMGSTSRYSVAQTNGGGTPWQRLATLTEDGIVSQSAEFYARPALAVHRPLASARLLVVAAAPWLRYRQPQGLTLHSGRLSFDLIESSVRLGKAKSLWFSGKLALLPIADAAAAQAAAAALRDRALARLERGLNLRPLPAMLDAAQIVPPLGGSLSAAPGLAYSQYLQRKHDDTVGDEPCTDPDNDVGSQWTCALTYGSQLWPDVQLDAQFGYPQNPDPTANEGKLNYWDPAHIELVEFLRSGDPQWLWDFALPQARLMAYTAYYNFGAQRGNNISGHSFGSGGSGDGLWHRDANGSADYSYNRHQALAYVLRPSIAQLDRFAAAGHAAGLRFTDDLLDPTSWSAIGRLNMQYIESLANCAQFVPGQDGIDCDSRLRLVLGRLIDTSMSAGLMCELKFNLDQDCFVGQLFMLQAWFYPILERLYLNYGESFPTDQRQRWRRALSETPARMLAGLPRIGGRVDVVANWPSGLLCQLGGPGFSQIVDCNPSPDLENLTQNKPATLSLFVRGHAYDDSLGLCTAAREIGGDLFAGSDPLGNLRAIARGGWWKGAAESGQELSTASLGYERCLP